jgi:hypothetical protein
MAGFLITAEGGVMLVDLYKTEIIDFSPKK